MDVKQYLLSYGKLDKEIDQKLEELQIQKSRCEKISTTYSDMPKAPTRENTREDAYVKMIDLSNEINAKIDKFVDLRKNIEKLIETIDDPTLRTVISYRYLNHKEWDDISRKLNYEVDAHNVYKLHNKALRKLKVDTILHWNT